MSVKIANRNISYFFICLMVLKHKEHICAIIICGLREI